MESPRRTVLLDDHKRRVDSAPSGYHANMIPIIEMSSSQINLPTSWIPRARRSSHSLDPAVWNLNSPSDYHPQGLMPRNSTQSESLSANSSAWKSQYYSIKIRFPSRFCVSSRVAMSKCRVSNSGNCQSRRSGYRTTTRALYLLVKSADPGCFYLPRPPKLPSRRWHLLLSATGHDTPSPQGNPTLILTCFTFTSVKY